MHTVYFDRGISICVLRSLSSTEFGCCRECCRTSAAGRIGARRGLHLRLRWQCNSRLQFKAGGPDFHAELIPVQSPLLRESYLVSFPPLTYMLKFSGQTRWAREGLERVTSAHERSNPEEGLERSRVYTYIYIYIYREREREMYIHIYIYIYTYICSNRSNESRKGASHCL